MFDAKEILAATKMDPTHQRAFLETVFQRGVRGSTEEAKAYIESKVAESALTRVEGATLKDLVERYSFYR